MECVEIEGLCDEGCWDNILVSMGISGNPVLMAKFIGDISFVMQTTEHHSLLSSTLPDPHTPPNRASDKPLNQLNNRAPDQLNNRVLDQLNTELRVSPIIELRISSIQPPLKPINGQRNKLTQTKGVRYHHQTRHLLTGTGP